MSKRAERAIEAYYGNIPDDADKVKAARHFYEQAEKDTIERAISWVRKNAYIYTDTQNDEEGNLMTTFLEEAFINDLKKAMEEEQ